MFYFFFWLSKYANCWVCLLWGTMKNWCSAFVHLKILVNSSVHSYPEDGQCQWPLQQKAQRIFEVLLLLNFQPLGYYYIHPPVIFQPINFKIYHENWLVAHVQNICNLIGSEEFNLGRIVHLGTILYSLTKKVLIFLLK